MIVYCDTKINDCKNEILLIQKQISSKQKYAIAQQKSSNKRKSLHVEVAEYDSNKKQRKCGRHLKFETAFETRDEFNNAMEEMLDETQQLLRGGTNDRRSSDLLQVKNVTAKQLQLQMNKKYNLTYSLSGFYNQLAPKRAGTHEAARHFQSTIHIQTQRNDLHLFHEDAEYLTVFISHSKKILNEKLPNL